MNTSSAALRGETDTVASARGRLSLLVAFLTLLVVGTDLFVISPLLPAISADYRVPPGVAGNAVTAFSLAYMLGAPLMGTLADRRGRRTVLVFGLAGFAVANACTGLAPSFAWLLVARVFAGLCAAGTTPCLLALVGRVAPGTRRATWMSTAMAGFFLSLTTGAPTGIALSSRLGWRAAFVGLAVFAAVLAVVNQFAWGGAVSTVPAEPSAAPAKVSLPTKLRAVSVTGIWAFAVYAFYTYLGTGLEHDAGFSPGLVAVALVVFGAGAVIGALSGGRLADRYGAARVATASLLLLTVMLVTLDATVYAPAWVLLVVLGVFALGAYPYLPVSQARLVSTFREVSGSVLAWNSFFLYLGTSLGSAVGGLLLNSAGFRIIPPACAAVGILGVVVYRRFAFARRSEAASTSR